MKRRTWRVQVYTKLLWIQQALLAWLTLKGCLQLDSEGQSATTALAVKGQGALPLHLQRLPVHAWHCDSRDNMFKKLVASWGGLC